MRRYDLGLIALLLVLWLLFFWRLFTPIAADQASFRQGDFSGQFVAFAGYQYERMAAGEIPLWNPYNNGGFPFIADTQAAVFYPPRLLTIGLSILAGGWSYNALQLEAAFHVLLYSLLMYAFVRRLTNEQDSSLFGAFAAAVIAAYGGFIAGYPMLQLAILEAAIWLPLAALGILEATRAVRLRWRWVLLAGFALGLSWMAGHPQTSWFMTYVLLAWLAYRVFVQRYSWRVFVVATILMGIVTLGTTAVTFFPGVEYLALASRSDLGFAAKGNGFPFQDVLQFYFPGSVSLFSPLYVGVPALVFALIALRYRLANARFWLAVVVVGLLLSFGANTALYHALYNFLPGLRFFRGQERAAFLVATSLAVLAGMGASSLAARPPSLEMRSLRRILAVVLLPLWGIAALVLFGWLGRLGEGFSEYISVAIFSSALGLLLAALMVWYRRTGQIRALMLLAALIVFELFSVNMDSASVYEARPASEQLSLQAPEIVQPTLQEGEQLFRVDGFRGLEANYGSLYGVQDIRGISPLFLQSAQRIIYRDYVNNPLAWELFAVRYVFSERESFGHTQTQVIAEGRDSQGPVYLHELVDPRPFALLLYRADVVDSDAFAQALLDDPRYDPRQSVIVQGEPAISLPDEAPTAGRATVTDFAPEALTVEIETPENALLSLALVDYPGWQATLDGTTVDIMRAYGALSAVAIPAGEHTLRLVYHPLSYRLGAIFSLFTWGALAILALVWGIRAIQTRAQER